MTGPFRTLVELARARAVAHPQRGYRFLGDGVVVSESLTYAELDRDARRIAVAIKESGVGKGARALLVYPSGLDFVRAFWGCFYAGAVAVPVPPPHPAKLSRTLPRLRTIANDCRADLVLTSSSFRETLDAVLAVAPELASKKSLLTDTSDADPDTWKMDSASVDDVAVLQYTSGSTSDPRGVMISHANLLHNLEMLRVFHLEQEHMVMISWLPVYHDMGLIRGMMSPLHMGGDCVMMSPTHFVQRPLKWLSAIAAYGGTTTGSPNFGFELCTRKVKEADIAKLDLSSLLVAFCTAEPIRKSTADRFAERFAPCGFRAAAFRPAYGLAEATVMVAGELGGGLRSWRVSESSMRDGRVLASDAADAYDLVSCGTPLGGQEVAIVDERGHRCAADRIGEVWVRGPSVGRGYWEKESSTRETFGGRLADGSGPFLRTGDLGCFAPDGGLSIVGRKKDLIIVRGENHYPHDIESTVEAAVPKLRPGCSTAFGLEGEGDAVVVVSEYDSSGGDEARWDDMVNAIRSAVSEAHEIALYGICFIAKGQIPKTASGKVQRSLARRMYIEGSLEVLHAWIGPPRDGVPAGRGASGGAAEAEQELLWFMVGWLSQRLRRSVGPGATFADLGLDAPDTASLIDALAKRTGNAELSRALILDWPSIGSLAAHLATSARRSIA